MKYRAEIDGLRAVAVVPVILFHVGLKPFSGGFVGVDVFFVLSGYLITSIIVHELEEGRFSLLGFYERRARRILPALLLVAVICIPIAWHVLLPADMQDFSQSLVAVALFSSNFLFWSESGYFGGAAELKPLLHTWSLAVEEQFYILFPLLLMAAWRFGRQTAIIWILVLVFAVSLGAAEWGAYNRPSATFYLLHSRAWELMIGAFAAFYLHKRHINTSIIVNNLLAGAGLAAILTAIFAFDHATPFPSLYALLPTLGTVLIILFALPGTWVHALLTRRIFVGIGLLSYSAYLWHQPLIAFYRHAVSLHIEIPAVLGILATVSVLSYLSWRYVERPFRQRARFDRITIFRMAQASLILLAVFGLFGHRQNGFSFRYPEMAALEKSVYGWEDKNACYFTGAADPQAVGHCYDQAAKKVYLIGDSHAHAISSQLRQELAAQGYGLIAWTENGCLPIPGTSRRPFSAHESCRTYKDRVFDFIADHPAPLIIAARWRLNVEGTRYDNGEGGVELGSFAKNYVISNPKADLVAHMEKELTALSARMPVVVVDQIPEAGWHVFNKAARRAILGAQDGEITTSYRVYLSRNATVRRLFDELAGDIKLVHTAPLVCRESDMRCRNTIDGLPLYRDEDHPSLILSRMIAREVGAVLRKIPN